MFSQIDLSQQNTAFRIFSACVFVHNQDFFIPLHCQKVNRLFRLVVIDLGF
jgi:hypothetical protein